MNKKDDSKLALCAIEFAQAAINLLQANNGIQYVADSTPTSFEAARSKLAATVEKTVSAPVTEGTSPKAATPRKVIRAAVKRSRKPAADVSHAAPVSSKTVAPNTTKLDAEVLVIETLSHRPEGVTAEELRRLTGLERGAFATLMRRVREAGAVRVQGEKRGTKYFADDTIPVASRVVRRRSETNQANGVHSVVAA